MRLELHLQLSKCNLSTKLFTHPGNIDLHAHAAENQVSRLACTDRPPSWPERQKSNACLCMEGPNLTTASPQCMQARLHGSCHWLQAAAEAARSEEASQRCQHGCVLWEEPLRRQAEHPLCKGLDCWPAMSPQVAIKRRLHLK